MLTPEESKHWPFVYHPEVWYIEDFQQCKGVKHYIVGNPHTFHGRMLVWCPIQDSFLCRSLSEMKNLTEAGKIWVDGFLCGNEPSYPYNKKNELNPRREVAHYKKLLKFRRTGYWGQ